MTKDAYDVVMRRSEELHRPRWSKSGNNDDDDVYDVVMSRSEELHRPRWSKSEKTMMTTMFMT